MNTTALYIGYLIIGIVGTVILLFGFALGWFAIHEARSIIYSRKWCKRKLKQMKLETAQNCAYYLSRWDLPEDMTIYEMCNYFDAKLRETQKK